MRRSPEEVRRGKARLRRMTSSGKAYALDLAKRPPAQLLIEARLLRHIAGETAKMIPPCPASHRGKAYWRANGQTFALVMVYYHAIAGAQRRENLLGTGEFKGRSMFVSNALIGMGQAGADRLQGKGIYPSLWAAGYGPARKRPKTRSRTPR